MSLSTRKILTLNLPIWLCAIALICAVGCKPNPRLRENKIPISFKRIRGIGFTEVDRRLKNGLSFNEYGYHLAPEWRLKFLSDDSVSLYSPAAKRFFNFPLACGIDSVFNTARSFLKIRHMSKDSLIFELLEAHNDTLNISGTKVYMIFYADNYIANSLHSTAVKLQHANKKDSTYIKSLVAKANADSTKVFAALQPVLLLSKSPSLQITKRKTIASFLDNNYNTSADYMDPQYDIVINKAYTDFYYSFSAYVNKDGVMSYCKPLAMFSDERYRDQYIKISKAIMDSYLKLYVKNSAGETLGIPHTSLISLHVKGISKPHTIAAE